MEMMFSWLVELTKPNLKISELEAVNTRMYAISHALLHYKEISV